MVPLILWELFSLFYYGFPFPNTAYAKLNVNIDKIVLMRQGSHYFLNSLRMDPITLIMIGMAILGVFLLKRTRQIPMAVGITLYLVYLLYIGGDFMSGRYFSLLFLIAVIMLSKIELAGYKFLLAGVMVCILGALPFLFTIERRPTYGDNRENNLVFFDDYKIADERLVYAERTGLMAGINGSAPKFVYAGGDWQSIPNPTSEVGLYGALGIKAYRAGPDVHAIDRNGLADPLMARLPLIDTEKWRIGHFHHRIPEGYLETLETGTNRIIDPDIASYYDKLSFVIKGPLWSWDRISEIWRLNTGKYDPLLG
jgi:arabinofuranosyltransferase